MNISFFFKTVTDNVCLHEFIYVSFLVVVVNKNKKHILVESVAKNNLKQKLFQSNENIPEDIKYIDEKASLKLITMNSMNVILSSMKDGS